MVERHVTGTSGAAVDADWRRCRAGMSDTRRIVVCSEQFSCAAQLVVGHQCTNRLKSALFYCAVYIVTGQSHTGTLWAATNAGIVYIYQLTVPAADKREEDTVQCILGLYSYFSCLMLTVKIQI